MITMEDIIREGHPTLRKKAEKITFPVSDEIRQLADDMMEFLRNSQDEELAEKYGLRGGVGSARLNGSRKCRATIKRCIPKPTRCQPFC